VQPFHLADLLRDGKLFTAWREASSWGRAKNGHAWELLALFGYSSVLPAWCRMGARNWLRGGYAPWPTNTEWTIPPWVRPDYARRKDLRGRILANIRRGHVSGQSAGLSLLLSSIDVYQDAFSRAHVAAPRGILLTHPFLDPRIFTLGLGTRLRVRPQPGSQKPILAAAMRGILPDCILDRPSKGNFNEAYFTGLSRNLGWLEDLVERAPADDLGFLDKPILLDCLQRTALGNSGDAGVLMQLNGTLSLLLWLTLQQRNATST
jgi:asparagine synthase (glutamine-hydrolysing)